METSRIDELESRIEQLQRHIAEQDTEIYRLSRRLEQQIQIKASGGIRSLSDALSLIEAGATRLGVSAAGQILAEFRGAPVSDLKDSSY